MTTVILDLRDSQGLRLSENGSTNQGWPSRVRYLIDGVPIIDSLFSTLQEDLAINTTVGAFSNNAASAQTAPFSTGTANITRPLGTMALSYKTSMSQHILGLLDTGEVFPSTNPGLPKLRLAGSRGAPWSTGRCS